MKRITLKSKEEKNKKTKQFIVAGVLVFIMFFSILGYSFQDSGKGNSQVVIYNGVKFVKQGNLWVTEGNFAFKYNPNEIEAIKGELNPAESYLGKPLYVYSENKEAEAEIAINLRGYAQRIQEACPEGKNCEGNLPEKTCNDNFVIIEQGDESTITQDNNCVFIKGSDLVKLSDEFLFKILKIR